MPELPEVETIVRDLNRKIIGRKITKVWSDWKKTVKKPADFNLFEKEVVGRKILGVRRKGKNILIDLSGGKILLVHQKMTGHLLVSKWKLKEYKVKSLPRKILAKGEGAKRISRGKKSEVEVIPLKNGDLQDRVNGYIHLIFFLDDGRQLALSDLRKFAKVEVGNKSDIEGSKSLRKLGPDPLDKDFALKKFAEILRDKKGKIKQVLMDQTVIAGVGNIYSDEILWEAKVNPKKSAKNLSGEELKKIYKAMKKILKVSIRLRGDSMSDFRDTAGKKGGYQNKHKAYRRTGEPCSRCKTPIERFKLGGRSGHFCPKCQDK